jgi:hypothetical protein
MPYNAQWVSRNRNWLPEKQYEYCAVKDITLEQMSLISTLKNCFILSEFVRNYFTCEWKYFYISMISGFSSFERCINEFSPPIFYRDISGIRSSTQSVVIRGPVPNFDSKLFLVPNYDTHTKFKQNPIFRRKQVF